MALIGPFFLLFFFFSALFLEFFFLEGFFFLCLSLRFCLTVKGAVGSVGVGSSVTSPFGSLVAGSGIALTAGDAIASVEARITARTKIPGLFLSVAMAQPRRVSALPHKRRGHLLDKLPPALALETEPQRGLALQL